MAQELIDYPDGTFAVDLDLVERIVRSYLSAMAQERFTREVVDEKWIGPDIYSIEVDWLAVNQAKIAATNMVWDMHMRAQAQGMLSQRQELDRMVRDTRLAKIRWTARLKSAQAKSMANIETSVHRGEVGVEVSKFVRDTSVGVLAVCATVLSGGSAAGIIGASAFGSGLEAAVKLQDTGDVKAAGFTFVSKFAIGLIPAGKGSDKLFMFILKNEAEIAQAGAQALVEGKTVEQALVASIEQAAAQVAGAAVGKLLKTPQASKALRRVAYPMTLKIDYPAGAGLGGMRQGVQFTRGVSGKLLGKAAGAGIGQASAALRSPGATAPRPIVDTAVLMDEQLANRAIQGPRQSTTRHL